MVPVEGEYLRGFEDARDEMWRRLEGIAAEQARRRATAPGEFRLVRAYLLGRQHQTEKLISTLGPRVSEVRGCGHDHDGYVMGYEHALNYMFEYLESLLVNAQQHLRLARAEERKLSAQWYEGQEAAFRLLLNWVEGEGGDDDEGDELKRIAGGRQGVPAGGVAAGGDLGGDGESGGGAAVSADEAPDGGGVGGVGDG